MEQLELDFDKNISCKREQFEYEEGVYVVEATVVTTDDDIFIEGVLVYQQGVLVSRESVSDDCIIRAYEIAKETESEGNAWDNMSGEFDAYL